jgi:hypothetical protein
VKGWRTGCGISVWIGAPVKLTTEHLIVVHVLPVVSARPDLRLGTADLQKLLQQHLAWPMNSRGYGPSFNMDGLIAMSNVGADGCNSFVQVFRNGFLESVESETLSPKLMPGQAEPVAIIPGIAWEKRILEVAPKYVKAMEVLGLPPPYVASVSLLNVRGYVMYAGTRYWGGNGRPVDRDHLITDEILIEAPEKPVWRLFRPVFDQVWNGCGWAASVNYDQNGDWVQRE